MNKNIYPDIVFLADVSLKRGITLAYSLVEDAALQCRVPVSDLYDRLSVIDNNYRMLLRALSEGVSDPSRDDVTRSLTYDLVDVVRRLTWRVMLTDPRSPLLRDIMLQARRGYMTSEQWQQCHDTLLDAGEDYNRHKAFDDALREAYEDLAFGTELSQVQYEGAAAIINDPSCHIAARKTLVSALTVNSLRYFNPRTFDMLVEIATYHGDLMPRALAGVAFNLVCNFDVLRLTPHFSGTMKLLEQVEECYDNLMHAFRMICFGLSGPRMADEMDKTLGSAIRMAMRNDKAQGAEKRDDVAHEGNPVWMNNIESVLADKMEDVIKIAKEGYDLHYSSFRSQVSMPYWNSEYHWFTPFYTEDPEFNNVFADSSNKTLLQMIMQQSFCPETHYKSIVLQLTRLPQNVINGIKQQVKEQMGDVMDGRAELEMIDKSSEMTYYIHDFFRFMTLYAVKRSEREGEPSCRALIGVDALTLNPFDVDSLHQCLENLKPTLQSVLTDFNQNLMDISFSFVNLTPPVDVTSFARLIDADTDASLLQQLGYLFEQVKKFREALSFYERADLQQPQDAWTMKRMVLCHHHLDNHAMAISVYEQMCDMFLPVDDLAQTAAESYYRIGEYAQSLGSCEQYLAGLAADAAPAVWAHYYMTLSQLRLQRYEQAKESAEELLAIDETPETLLIAGHLALAARDTSRAIAFYHKAYRLTAAGNANRVADPVRVLLKFKILFDSTAEMFFPHPDFPSDQAQLHFLVDAAMYEAL